MTAWPSIHEAIDAYTRTVAETEREVDAFLALDCLCFDGGVSAPDELCLRCGCSRTRLLDLLCGRE